MNRVLNFNITRIHQASINEAINSKMDLRWRWWSELSFHGLTWQPLRTATAHFHFDLPRRINWTNKCCRYLIHPLCYIYDDCAHWRNLLAFCIQIKSLHGYFWENFLQLFLIGTLEVLKMLHLYQSLGFNVFINHTRAIRDRWKASEFNIATSPKERRRKISLKSFDCWGRLNDSQ